MENQAIEPLAMPVGDASRRSNLSRAYLYQAMQAGELAYLKIGRRRLILLDDLRDYLASKRKST